MFELAVIVYSCVRRRRVLIFAVSAYHCVLELVFGLAFVLAFVLAFMLAFALAFALDVRMSLCDCTFYNCI